MTNPGLLLWLATTLLAVALGGGAAAAPAMTFALVRQGGPACEPDCPEWIAADGEIAQGSAAAFRAFLAKLDARRRPVIVNSNGGSVEDALEIGRLIRARRLAVAVGRTVIFPPPTAQDRRRAFPPMAEAGYVSSHPAFCLSACSLILAAGVERFASPLATVGVHEVKERQTRTLVMRRYLIRYRVVNGIKQEVSRQLVAENKNTYTSTQIDPAAVDARLVAYFKEMGEDASLLQLMRTATPDQIHRLSAQEEMETRLVTMSIIQPSPMSVKPPRSGLDGAPLDPTSDAPAGLDAEQSWPLPPSDAFGERRFVVHFQYLRGGAGVAATYVLLDPSRTPLRYGVAPGAHGMRQVATRDGRTLTLFIPNAIFCRFVRVGDLDVQWAAPLVPPTQASGLPDPRAPLLLTPFAAVNGVSALADEICSPAAAAPAPKKRVFGARRP